MKRKSDSLEQIEINLTYKKAKLDKAVEIIDLCDLVEKLDIVDSEIDNNKISKISTNMSNLQLEHTNNQKSQTIMDIPKNTNDSSK